MWSWPKNGCPDSNNRAAQFNLKWKCGGINISTTVHLNKTDFKCVKYCRHLARNATARSYVTCASINSIITRH